MKYSSKNKHFKNKENSSVNCPCDTEALKYPHICMPLLFETDETKKLVFLMKPKLFY